MMMGVAALFGHWAIVSAACAPATGFAIAPHQLTLYSPAGFANQHLPPKLFEATSSLDGGSFDIAFRRQHGEIAHMRFQVRGDKLVDTNGYKYRRCPPTKGNESPIT
jgi:hypothetical protein